MPRFDICSRSSEGRIMILQAFSDSHEGHYHEKYQVSKILTSYEQSSDPWLTICHSNNHIYLAAPISKYDIPLFGRLISPRFTKMAAWNIWKASFFQGSPDALEPSTPQREASSIYWLFQVQTWNLSVQQSTLIVCMCNSVTSPWWTLYSAFEHCVSTRIWN